MSAADTRASKVCPGCEAHFVPVGVKKCTRCKNVDAKRATNASRRAAYRAAKKAAR